MRLILPQMSDRFLCGVGACWHIPAEAVANIDDVKGDRIASCEHGGRSVFLRSIVHRARTAGSVIHMHVELRVSEAFKTPPVPDVEIDELEKVFETFIGARDADAAEFSIECELAWEQVALGGMFSPFGLMRDDLLREHQAIMTSGGFVLLGDAADSLSFTTKRRDGDPFLNVAIEVRHTDPVSWDSLAVAASRLRPEFDRLVLGHGRSSAARSKNANE